MKSESEIQIWVFNGNGGQFPSGVFSSLEKATAWIAEHALSGTLTAYPLDHGVFDWAIEKGMFKPKRPDQQDSAFIGRFTTAAMRHFHFVNGKG